MRSQQNSFFVNFTMGMFLLQNEVCESSWFINVATAKSLLMNEPMSNVFINKCSLDIYSTDSMQYRHKVASVKHA